MGKAFDINEFEYFSDLEAKLARWRELGENSERITQNQFQYREEHLPVSND